MTRMNIILNGDNAWPDLAEKPADKLHHSRDIAAVCVLDGGMASGAPSVAFRIELPDGSTVVAETSAKLFVTAARAIHGRFPNLLD